MAGDDDIKRRKSFFELLFRLFTVDDRPQADRDYETIIRLRSDSGNKQLYDLLFEELSYNDSIPQ